MPKHDYSTWFSKQEAADAIGVSTKTIEQLAKDGKLQSARWKKPTGVTVAVYHPEDVQHVRKERNPEADPFILPPDRSIPEPSRALAPVAPGAEQFFRALAAAVGSSQSSEKVSEVRIPERLFLSIPDAANYSGLPQTHIRRLLADKKLKGMKTGAGWRIRRADLEKL